ncbi:alpha/beta fold hydrolase [Candidatus Methylocalor cossyra]|uniref:Alpha/beta hydrolase fold protein n=1 Tax=Candidatus Methylocalor cossyra TaxID=3108543 RepID=A0ABM9NEX7_9GAMM
MRASLRPPGDSEDHYDRTLTLRDGRRLGFADVGDSAGRAVLYCHGFPACRKEAALVATAARRQGARIVAPDRPGYGLSDWWPERTFADWPGDVAQLADALGWGRFAVLAVSGGAPYGLALAHGLGERVESLTIVAGLGPVYDPVLAMAMHPPARFGFAAARRAPWLLRLVYGRLFGALLRTQPELCLRLLTVAVREADRATLSRPEVRAALSESIREALRSGTQGALLDFALYARDWGFDPGKITQPVVFWHGEADATVPLAHTLCLAERMPNATVIRCAGEGHFSLPIEHAGEILDKLLHG